MKLRCLLVDDEPPALAVLQTHMAQISGLELVASCANAIEAMEVLHKRAVDVIFLDIKMPMLLGTDFLRSLSHPPRIVFVTAYRDYAVEGFELDAVDYLVKPVSFQRFLKAIDKLKRKEGQSEVQVTSYDANPEAFVYLRADRSMRKVVIQDIIYIESLKDYVKIVFTQDKPMIVKQSISAIENLLSEHKFVRVHRSYLVSVKRISNFNHNCVTANGVEIPIGRLYKQRLMEVLAKPPV